METLRQQVKQRIRAMGISQKEVAAVAKITPGHLSRYLNGKGDISTFVLDRILDLLYFRWVIWANRRRSGKLIDWRTENYPKRYSHILHGRGIRTDKDFEKLIQGKVDSVLGRPPKSPTAGVHIKWEGKQAVVYEDEQAIDFFPTIGEALLNYPEAIVDK